MNDYWGKFAQLGVSHRDLLDMDWGDPVDEGSENFQKIVQKLVRTLDDQYFDLKRKEESISINDIMRDLQAILMDGVLPETDLSMKYLFIDEFQDSDLSQIIKIAPNTNPTLIACVNPANAIELKFAGHIEQKSKFRKAIPTKTKRTIYLTFFSTITNFSLRLIPSICMISLIFHAKSWNIPIGQIKPQNSRPKIIANKIKVIKNTMICVAPSY